MNYIAYLFISFLMGGVIAWIISTLWVKSGSVPKEEMEILQNRSNTLNSELLLVSQKLNIREGLLLEFKSEIADLKQKEESLYAEIESQNRELALKEAKLSVYVEKLNSQKEEMIELRRQFNIEFENIASRILDEKSEKFTKINRDNLDNILKPLGENIESFRKKVEDVYNAESKERFHLGEEVKKLAQLNHKISEEAVNLTNALKGNSKTQGDWGEMILENILERSGLVRNREYFVQEFLRNKDGIPLVNESGKRMQPDVIVVYPDKGEVIIDSKVSLIAYLRYTQTSDKAEQQVALNDHIRSIRKHIDDLSGKNYQKYAQSLDFTMMFVPNEPAYMMALEHDSELWQYAYDKKILLISPTNLIAALKLIADLWKREYQNRNTLEIAERGAKLYDKFVGFISNLQKVGKSLGQAQKTYDHAYKQLSTGNDNLVVQTEKLKELGVQTKKQIPNTLLVDK